MKIQVAIRMTAQARDRLKLISVLEKKPMGDLVEELIDAKFARCKQFQSTPLQASPPPQPTKRETEEELIERFSTPEQNAARRAAKEKRRQHDKKKRGF